MFGVANESEWATAKHSLRYLDLVDRIPHRREGVSSLAIHHVPGEKDPIIEVHENEFLRTHADDLVFELVPDAGHFPVEERPDWVRERVLNYLAEGLENPAAF
jgi:pimeloyl-ACP methyl ester carboxylesterase